MEHFFKFKDDHFTLTFPKTIFPKHLCISLSTSFKVMLFIILYLVVSLFLNNKQEPIFLVLLTIFLFIVYKTYFTSSPEIYLVDYSCLKPPNYWRVPFSAFLEHSRIVHNLDQESVDFMSKILVSSGQSQRTCIPPSLHYIPPRSTNEEAINEAQIVLFPVFEDLLSKTQLSPLDIDILIVNCSGFCPSPSLSSIIINKYSMREDIKSFNISGMGCSASALGVDMAQNLLKVHKNSNAVILSTEILSNGWYSGKDRSMMVLNCLFRTGSAAILISNKASAKRVSKYRLLYALRTQGAFDDIAYKSAIREEDDKGIIGVTLKKDVLHVAGELLRTSFQTLGSSILPLEEKIKYGFSIIRKKFLNNSRELYVPNFRKVIQHYCLPTSGKTVITEIGKKMKLKEDEVEPALMTLHRFGNQSSSSLWYELAYMEGKERVKQGERVLQLGMGSGPKCTSLVWECTRPIIGEACKGPWADCIDSYPVYSCFRKDKI
ncbi:3-ketoacyl-CoA synthase 7 [Artemisia annua]|uniref:3-ketoacyl-CoA synthase n=1 Tax=Artemisia annua TaxID=35608 RepID=A0A2U1MLB8_ARTAN|nr:3-ketoacyl-CoA synthase 7 [Artemisia annua]